MDKRSSTISARVTPELEHQLQQIALARDTTVSDLNCAAMTEVAERERTLYIRLRCAFEETPDLYRFAKTNTSRKRESFFCDGVSSIII